MVHIGLNDRNVQLSRLVLGMISPSSTGIRVVLVCTTNKPRFDIWLEQYNFPPKFPWRAP